MGKRKQADGSSSVATTEGPPVVEVQTTPDALAEFKPWLGAVLVPLDRLLFTDWNVNEMSDAEFSELVSEIEQGGFDEPGQIVPAKDKPGFFVLLGGEHRARACKALGINEMPCVLKTHLSDADEATIKMWTVKRNNIHGAPSPTKYAALERALSERHKITAEIARRKMLIRGELLKALKKTEARNGESSSGEGDGDADGDDGTQGSRDAKSEIARRKKLLAALKNAEEEVLIQSADTVQHGYLFFGQGQGNHLVVNETQRLHALVQRMVAACKSESSPVDDFLCAAIEAELTKWETKGA